MKKCIIGVLAFILILAMAGCNKHPDNVNDISTNPTETETPDHNNAEHTDDINDLKKPVTNLEFWITENVDNVDFSKYQEKYGMFGGNQYYGTGYVPTIDENGQQVDPEYCVLYTVTSYPDYSDKEQHITSIYVTDPKIEFYGITLNSSFEDFEYYIEQQGFEIRYASEAKRTAQKGSVWITITTECIRIDVEVTNEQGIVF